MSKQRQSEMVEGPEAFERFNNAIKAVLAVPHSVIKQRIEEYRKASGRESKSVRTKAKGQASASSDPDV
jgi:hypothetical protein